jgi:ligand-binding sensor protein
MKISECTAWGNWVQFEKEFNERTGLNCCVIDQDGVRVTAYRKWANPLCPAIRRERRGQILICDRLQSLYDNAPETRNSLLVSTCRAGLIVICIPVWHEDTYLGLTGGCGLLHQEGQVDAMTVLNATELGISQIRELSRDIGRLLPQEIENLGQYLKRRFKGIC